MTISFSSDPVEKEAGELITVQGSFTFDMFTPSKFTHIEGAGSSHYYQFKANQGAFAAAQVGELQLSSPLTSAMDAKSQYSASITHQFDRGGVDGSCYWNFSYSDESQGENGDGLHHIMLTLIKTGCDPNSLPDRLPYNIDLDEWDVAKFSILYSVDGVFDLCSLDVADITVTRDDITRVKGEVFWDNNSDCQIDAGEQTLSKRTVTFTPGPFRTTTDTDGKYSIYLPPGNYSASVQNLPLWEFTCIEGPKEFVISDTDEEIEANFAMDATELREALEVSLVSGRARPGFGIQYFIRLYNSGTLPYSGEVSFNHAAMLTDFTSQPAADDYAGTFATWELSDLPVGAVQTINISMLVPADETLLGEIICAEVISDNEPTNNDQVLATTSDEMCVEIRGAYDPNDIQVFSGTRNADGAITQDDQTLSYLIRFQNEGNEPAITVRVVDELSQYHKIESIRIGAASHDFTFNFTHEGKLEWVFNDINLVPKSIDEAASQGFVKFKVRLKDELAIGTEIPNSAAIYFDFNSPVITNTVVSRITSTTTSVDENVLKNVKIYPNPSSDKISLVLPPVQNATIVLRNTLGQTLINQTVKGPAHELDVQHLSAAVYYLTIQTGQNTSTRTINIIR